MSPALRPLLALRERLVGQLRPIAARLAGNGVSPLRLTWATLAVAASVGLLLAAAPAAPLPLLLLPAALAARAAANALADLLIREHGHASARAALLREVADALADALLYLPLALAPGVAGWLIVVVVVLGLAAEIAALAGAALGASRRRDGPLASNDRALLFGIIALVLALDPRAAGWLPWLLVPAALLAAATIANRVRGALRELEHLPVPASAPRPEQRDAPPTGA